MWGLQFPFAVHVFSPHLCVGFLFLVLYPVRLRPPASVCPPPAASHTTWSHTTYTHTHNLHTHNLSTHNLLTHTTCSHTTYSHTTCTHTHTTYSHTTYSHITCTHTHTTYSHTTCSRTTCPHTQFVNSFTWQLCVAGVALSDTHIHFVWQEWHLATWAFTLRGRCGILTLRGRRGTYGIGLALVACLGLSWRRGRRGFWRGRRGTWRHRASILRGTRGTYGTGLALAARLGLSWRRGRRGFLRGKRGTWWHGPSLCVAGVALGDMDRHFAWQAWHLWHWVAHLGLSWRRGRRGFLRGRRGAWWHGPSLCVAGVALGDMDPHFAWQRGTCGTGLALTPSLTHHFVTHHLSHTVFHRPSFTHNFVTHHLWHFVTHHLSHTTLSHTTLSHTVFVTHHLSHTTLSHTMFCHTIFHTPLCHTPSFTHNFVTLSLSHTTFTHHLSHHFVTHHLWHTIFASPSFPPLCHTQSVTYNFVTHNSSHTTCFTSRSSTTSFVFPALPVPLQHLLPIIGRSWHVGLSGPLIVEWPRVALLDEAGLCRKTVVQAPKNCFFAHA